jgi:UDP-glucose 4-epimerase
MGEYYKIPPDGRDLNYAKYFSQGNEKIAVGEDYNSHNTKRLSPKELTEMLLKLDFISSTIKK